MIFVNDVSICIKLIGCHIIHQHFTKSVDRNVLSKLINELICNYSIIIFIQTYGVKVEHTKHMLIILTLVRASVKVKLSGEPIFISWLYLKTNNNFDQDHQKLNLYLYFPRLKRYQS